MKKVILHGAFQNDNFGDVLLLLYFSRILKEEGFEVILSNSGQEARRVSELREATLREKFDARIPVVFAGGGYWGEPPKRKFKWSLNLFARHLWFALLSRVIKRNYIVANTGFGPLSGLYYRWPVVYSLDGAGYIGFRDQESCEYFTQYGGSGKAVLSADAILAMKGDQLLELVGVTKEGHDIVSPCKVLSVHIPGDERSVELRKKIAECINKESKTNNLIIQVISDNPIGKEHDYFEWFKGGQVTYHSYESPKKTVELLMKSDYVITTKLHIGICASVLNKCILSFPAHTKTIRYYKQIGREELVVKSSSLELVRNSIYELLHDDLKSVVVPEGVINSAQKYDLAVKSIWKN